MPATLLRPEHHWVCPNCTLTQVTHETEPHTRFHACRGLRGLTAPMVADGTRCKIEISRPEDYVANAGLMHLDGEGRPAVPSDVVKAAEAAGVEAVSRFTLR